MCNNSNLDLVNINAYAKPGQMPFIYSKILSGNKIFTLTKGHNYVGNVQK